MTGPAAYICGDGPLVVPDQGCPNASAHTPRPRGYVGYDEWVGRMLRTHEQQLCDGCDRWNIWVEVDR